MTMNFSIFWVFTKFGITFEIFEKSTNVYLRILKYSILVKSLTSDNKKPKAEKEERERKPKKPYEFGKYIPLLKKMLTPILKLLNRLYKSFRFSRINIGAEIGMNDPANLGTMYGLYCSGSHLFPEWADITIKPNFQRNVFIGEGKVNWNPRAEVHARYRLYEESYSLPAISIGFNSQGYGAYLEADSIKRYTIKSKGFYVVGSKNYSFLGVLGFHGGINLSLEDSDGDNDPNFFVGFDKSISSEISFVGEYDFAINDNEDNSLVAKKGYLNSGLKWNIGSNLNLEINIKNLLNNRKNVPDSNREIKIIYREFF